MKATGGIGASRQLDLFSSVLHAYTAERDGRLDNQTLYAEVAERAGIDPDEFARRSPIGESGQLHSLTARATRWHQQTLKHAGILERVEGQRGVWQLTQPASKKLDSIVPMVSVVGFSTDLGVAILGSCDSVFSRIDAPIVLALTSSPFPLRKPRAYGNVDESVFVDWLIKHLEPVVRNLVPGGSLVLNLSNDVFLAGMPARSMYTERLLLALHDRLGLYKVDTLPWVNKSKPPGPVRWASMDRVLLNTTWEPCFWLTNDPTRLRSDNRRVLLAHTEKHLALIQRGGEQREAIYSDGAYRIHQGSYGNPTAGKIPRNLLEFGHACADQRAYKKAARAHGLPVHGAPMPLALVKFLIEYMSEPGDLIVDMFAGSFTTPKAAELLGRRWLATEIMLQYVLGGSLRFENCAGFRRHLPLSLAA